MTDIIYSWKFSGKKDRSGMWYIVALSAVIGIVVWGFITRQYGLSLVLLLVAGVFFYVENNSADEVQVNLTESGIQIAESFYDFSKISQFIFVTHGHQVAMVRFTINKSKVSRSLDIDVTPQVANELREILTRFIPEGQTQELGFMDKITHFFNL